jgi:flavin reductase (DIM6/NTAB) family NADH-FMN oxidoreductase RutF
MTDKSHSHADPARDEIGRVLGRTPSGVYILTASDGAGRETGMLASWVQQASFEPPIVSIAVNQKRYLHDWLSQSPTIALSLIGKSHGRFLRHFGRGFDADQPAFEGVEIHRSPSGLPVLAGALGFLEGAIVGKAEAGHPQKRLPLLIDRTHEYRQRAARSTSIIFRGTSQPLPRRRRR